MADVLPGLYESSSRAQKAMLVTLLQHALSFPWTSENKSCLSRIVQQKTETIFKEVKTLNTLDLSGEKSTLQMTEGF